MSFYNLDYEEKRFIQLAKKNTRSYYEHHDQIPSSPGQVELAKELVKEMKELGLDAYYNEKTAFAIGKLSANTAEKVTPIGFFAHVDTADFNAHNVQPQIVENYDGESDIKLDEAGNFVLTTAEFPNLKNYKGHDLITTDGSTLLGADDKSGVAEIMSAMEYLQAHPEIKHGEIKVGFGPDEEIGTGADNFNVEDFGADIAYTVDGGPLGELEYETFNAAQAKLTFKGKDVHTGTAKNVMVNAIQLAINYQNSLPADEVPEKTEGREGFFHLFKFDGSVEEAHTTYIIRDHDRKHFEERKQLMLDIAERMNTELGEERVVIDLQDQYYNMREVLEKDMTAVDIAKEAMEDLGITPEIYPVRGGTDGSKISFMGLPTPNLFAGGENMHGRYEYVSTQVMEKATDVILEIVKLLAK